MSVSRKILRTHLNDSRGNYKLNLGSSGFSWFSVLNNQNRLNLQVRKFAHRVYPSLICFTSVLVPKTGPI